MTNTYGNCFNLTGAPVCGGNVTNMSNAYINCVNIGANAYFYSSKIQNVRNCFGGKNISNMLNIYLPSNSTSLSTCLQVTSYSIVGQTITWTNDTANDCYYNTEYNIYMYPVDDVAAARTANGD